MAMQIAESRPVHAPIRPAMRAASPHTRDFVTGSISMGNASRFAQISGHSSTRIRPRRDESFPGLNALEQLLQVGFCFKSADFRHGMNLQNFRLVSDWFECVIPFIDSCQRSPLM